MSDELDSEGLHVARPGTIRTWSGMRVDPLDMHASDVMIEDVAHALARQCRYNGHCEGFLSVARHSLWVAEALAPFGRELQLWGLLHDAAEAYLGDMVRPLKHAPEMEAFRKADGALDRVIAEAFDLPWPMPKAVTEADAFVLLERELAFERDRYEGDVDRDEADFLDAYASLRGYKKAKRAPIVVGLTGVARSGKDTVGSVLVEKCDFVRLSFAGKLYGMLLATDPFVPVRGARTGLTHYERLSVVVERLGWEAAKDTIPEVRQLLQRLGTEGGRAHLGESVWIDAAISDVRAGGRYVFTDVRFANEAEAIRKLGGEVWRVERPGFEPVNSHVSDAGIPADLISRTIANDGTRADLRRAVLSTFTPA